MNKTLLILLFSFLFGSLHAQQWDEVMKAVASDRAMGDSYGISVSVDGNYAIVGADVEDHDVLGANFKNNAGSAYILERDTNGNWSEIQKIVASDRQEIDVFGTSASISENYAIVSATGQDYNAIGGAHMPNAGAAYIFEKDVNGVWIEAQKIVASDRDTGDFFGSSVSISGGYAIVGAYNEGHDTAGVNYLEQAGSAYVFERNASGVWQEVQKLVASDRQANDWFGLEISMDSNYVIFGVHFQDYDASGGNFIALAGAAYIFERDVTGIWRETQKLVAADREFGDFFGQAVSIDGNFALVTAYTEDHNALGTNFIDRAGSAYVFERNGGVWNQVQKLVASDRQAEDFFGYSAALEGDFAVISAYQEDHDTSGMNVLNDAGSAYIFKKDAGGNWSEIQKIVASDRGADDQFGWGEVAIGDSLIFVGASHEDHDTSGANFMLNSGSVYIFAPCENTDSTLSPDVCNAYTSPSGKLWNTSGMYLDTIANALGCDSILTINLTVRHESFDTIAPVACQFYISPSSQYVWDSSGTYLDTLSNAAGCDSILTINLTVNTVPTDVIATDSSLIANGLAGASYQWLDCNAGYSVIAGATMQGFDVTSNGNYAVEITVNNCSDTSDCFAFTHIGLMEHDFGADFIVYPNPTSKRVQVDLGTAYPEVTLVLMNAIGQEVFTKSIQNEQFIEFDIAGAPGVYLLEVRSSTGQSASVRVLKK